MRKMSTKSGRNSVVDSVVQVSKLTQDVDLNVESDVGVTIREKMELRETHVSRGQSYIVLEASFDFKLEKLEDRNVT